MNRMRVDCAIIGGTGIGSRLVELGGASVHVPTRYGCVRGRRLEMEGLLLFVLSRHSAGHNVPPHKVPYLALAEAVRKLGAKGCLASAAVGCTRAEWPVGTFAAVTDFLDPSGRFETRFDRGVAHTDFSDPFPLHQALISAANEQNRELKTPAVYLNANGPRYETPAEIKMYRQWGTDLVGMTAGSEAIAMREAGVPYGCLAIVTNMASGMGESELSHHEVVDVMKTRGAEAVGVLLGAAKLVAAS